jgi:hypothetical protein
MSEATMTTTSGGVLIAVPAPRGYASTHGTYVEFVQQSNSVASDAFSLGNKKKITQ